MKVKVESQKVVRIVRMQPTVTQGVSGGLRANSLAHIGHAHFEGARNSKTARKPRFAMAADKGRRAQEAAPGSQVHLKFKEKPND